MLWQGQTNVTTLIRPVDQMFPTPYSRPNPTGQHAGHSEGTWRRNLTLTSLAHAPAPDLLAPDLLAPAHQFCGKANAHRD